jgi:formamidopyrimidine-DNA glycosylase
LQQVLPARRIVDVTLTRGDLRYPIPVAAVQALHGATFQAVRRRAKYLLCDLQAPGQPDRVLLVHLGMSGRLFIDPNAPAEWRKHEHWRLQLEPDMWLRYVDARRFGALDVLELAHEAEHALLATLGPEPLDPQFTAQHLLRVCKGRQVALKLVLMDQKAVVGIGNIYASEALFRAGLHPLRSAKSLKLKEAKALVAASREVLQEAIAAGGSTLRDFVGGDEAPGYFQQRLDVYGRDGEPCHRCGAPVAHVVLGTRATYFCPACQIR